MGKQTQLPCLQPLGFGSMKDQLDNNRDNDSDDDNDADYEDDNDDDKDDDVDHPGHCTGRCDKFASGNQERETSRKAEHN